jgi:hypothetical protein
LAIFFAVFVTLLTIENVDVIVARFIADFNTSIQGITLFIIISISYIFGQMFLVKFLNSASHAIKARSGLIAGLHKAVSVVQYVLAANVILVIIQILSISQYSTLSLIFVAYVSNFLTAILLATFAIRFVSWYRNKKNSLGILLFALAFLILAVSEVVAGIGSAYLISQKDNLITPYYKFD